MMPKKEPSLDLGYVKTTWIISSSKNCSSVQLERPQFTGFHWLFFCPNKFSSFLGFEGERLINSAKMQFQYYFRQCCCNPFLKNVICIVYVSWKMMSENCWCVRHKPFWNILKQLKKMLMMMSQFLGLLKNSPSCYAEIFREFMMIG